MSVTTNPELAMKTKLTKAEQAIVDRLRNEGFAITIFNPKELGEVDSYQVEDHMVEKGWDIIEILKS